MIIRFSCIALLISSFCRLSSAANITVDFEGLLPANAYENGASLSGGFASQGVQFNNYYDTTYGPYWEGWAYSTMTDTTTDGYTNQYSAFPGSGASSPGYAVGFTGGFVISPVITLPDGYQPQSLMVANTTYAALAIRDGLTGGVGGVRQFGPGDYFILEITGQDASNVQTGAPIDFYLADYRDGATFVATDWTQIDLSPLAGAKTLHFALTSTDNGQFGMNTPAYFALDNLTLQPVPEPPTAMLALVAAAILLAIARRRIVAHV